uniref:Uncharacterized protein n=1 Tax=Cacopsylla melanoneura TaxID=428564 RepID=A0A8D8Y3Q3_9HEMI
MRSSTRPRKYTRRSRRECSTLPMRQTVSRSDPNTLPTILHYLPELKVPVRGAAAVKKTHTKTQNIFSPLSPPFYTQILVFILWIFAASLKSRRNLSKGIEHC